MKQRAVNEIDDDKYDEWEVSSALRTLVRAEEIKKDSKMMKLVQTEAKKQKENTDLAVKTVADYNKLSDKDKSKFMTK